MTIVTAGRSGRRWKRLHAEQKAKRLPCCWCGQPINYEAADPNAADAFSVEHKLPLSTHPHLAEDPSNLDSAHQRCNKRRGNGTPAPMLGTLSEQW